MQNSSFIKELAKGCRTVEDVQEKLRDLFKDTLQEVFEAEMDEHLGYEKHDAAGKNSGNNRNGYSCLWQNKNRAQRKLKSGA